MIKILLCTGEENAFDTDMTMFKCDNSEYQIDYVKMFSSEKSIDRIKRNMGKIFIKEQLSKELKEDLSKYNCIIFFECTVKNYAIEYIRKKNPNIRIIIYFRNKFSYSKKRNLSVSFLKKLNCEFWSYNENDCKEQNFKFNSQFWNTKFYEKINKNEMPQYDVTFLGRIKNRENEILSIESICNKNSLNSYIYLVPKSEFEFDRNTNNDYMNYIDYLKTIGKSKVIVDLVNKNNYGLTIRPLESIFLKKKLITNYKNIVNYDFYNKNNVFLLGSDDVDKINDFINDEYEEIDTKIVEKYDFKNWITNFFKED